MLSTQAAHCLNIEGKKLSHIRTGDWRLSTEIDCDHIGLQEFCAPKFERVNVNRKFEHPKYSSKSSFNRKHDIALLRLSKVLKFSKYVQPICLMFNEDLDGFKESSTTLTAIGWGKTENGSPSDVLLSGELPYVEFEKCKTFYKYGHQDNMDEKLQFCAGGGSVDTW